MEETKLKNGMQKGKIPSDFCQICGGCTLGCEAKCEECEECDCENSQDFKVNKFLEYTKYNTSLDHFHKWYKENFKPVPIIEGIDEYIKWFGIYKDLLEGKSISYVSYDSFQNYLLFKLKIYLNIK
jgi:hypothetical protein